MGTDLEAVVALAAQRNAYVKALALAYLLAPEYSREEELLEQSLHAACARYSFDTVEILRLVAAETPGSTSLDRLSPGEPDGDNDPMGTLDNDDASEYEGPAEDADEEAGVGEHDRAVDAQLGALSPSGTEHGPACSVCPVHEVTGLPACPVEPR